MIVNEFIEKVASGELVDKDIISFCQNDHKDIVKSTAFDMWAYSVSLQEQPTPNNCRAIGRLDYAVQLMEKHFGFSLFSDNQSLNPEPQQEQPEAREDNVRVLQLPDELNTETAQAAFGKAIEKRWMNIEQDGKPKWVGFGKKGRKAQWAYLCAKIWGYKYSATKGNIGGSVPYEALELFFGETRLDRAVQQVFEATKPQPWRLQIDALFESI